MGNITIIKRAWASLLGILGCWGVVLDATAQTVEFAVLPEVTVTGTREQSQIKQSAVSVGVIGQSSIEFTRPSHPQQILGQIPGVAIGVTNGEGHNTAIRQGFSTSPVYLFLEDGIPIRATGNFNHNALYELNLPSAGGVEVIRGIGTALYGSDAIGGTINVLTKTPSATARADGSVEIGGHGFGRVLGGLDSGRSAFDALRADVNITHTDGWRDRTAYDRQSLNLRWDREIDSQTLSKTILGYTKIDQQTGANSALPYVDYMNNPTKNLRADAYRKVEALRLSTEWMHDIGNGQMVTLVPYLRNNKMDLNGSYNFSGDARVEVTEVTSYGLMSKYRKDFSDAWRTRVIVGLDLDYSPSTRLENKIALTTSTSNGATNYAWTGALGATIYDYSTVYQSAAPYTHLEVSPLSKLRVSLGVRYDTIQYTSNNNLAAGYVTSGSYYYYTPANASASFSRASPKLGVTYALSAADDVHASYHQGFRTPSESQLFRGGRATTQAEALALANAAAGLKPITADQYELGVRGQRQTWNYEAVAYQLTKKNDLLSQKDSTGYAVQTNNGETTHRGVELALGAQFMPQFRADLAASYAKHKYAEWVTSTVNYSGKEIESAPRVLGNLRLSWKAASTAMVQLEMVKVGAYFMDQLNTQRYNGYALYNLRSTVQLTRDLSMSAQLLNLTNQRYADSASGTGTAALYAPGLPRTAYVGLNMRY